MKSSFLPRKFRVGKTGVLRVNPLNGHPDSETVNVTLYNPGGSELQVSAAMTAAIDTTVDANSGPSQTNPYLLNVASTSGVAVGDILRPRNAQGQDEQVEVFAINSAASFQCKDKLVNEYVNTDTVDSLTYTYSITATHTAAAGKFFRAEIAYASNSVNFIDVVPFNVKENIYEPRLNTRELYKLFRDLREYEGYQDNYDDQILFAFDEISSELAALNLDIDNLLPGRLEICHAYKTMVIISRRWMMNNPEVEPMADKYEAAYKECFEGLTERTSYYDTDEDGVSDTDEVDVDQWYRGTASSFETVNPFGLDSDVLTPEEDIDREW